MDEKTKKLNVHFLALCGMLATLSQLIFIPSIILIRDELSATNFEISLMIAGYTVAQAIAQLVYGPIVDRFPAKTVLLMGLIIFCLSNLGIFFAHSVEMIVILRIVQGLSVSAGSVCGSALISDMFEGKNRDRALTVFHMYFSMGAVIGPAIGAFMRFFVDWRYVFLFLVIFSATVIIFLYKKLKIAERVQLEKFSLGKALKSIQQFELIAICIAGCGLAFVMHSYQVSLSFLFADYLSIHANWTGFVFMAMPLGALTGLNISKALLTYLPREKILIAGLLGISAASGLFLIPLYFFDLTLMIITSIILLYVNGVAVGMAFPMVSAIAIHWFSHIRGTVISIVFFGTSIGFTLGPLMTGVMISKQGVPAIYSLIFTVALCSVLICYLGLTVKKRKEKNMLEQQGLGSFPG